MVQIKLRGLLSHIQQIRIGYWGPSSGKAQSVSSYGMPSPRSQDVTDESQQPAEASGVGRSWVQSMFSRDSASRMDSFSRVRRWTSDSGSLGISFIFISDTMNEISCLNFSLEDFILLRYSLSLISAANDNMKNTASPSKPDLPVAGQKKIQSGVRILRGHTGAVTALHCVTRREVWDLVGDREDAGFFISGSTDCTVTYLCFSSSYTVLFVIYFVLFYFYFLNGCMT